MLQALTGRAIEDCLHYRTILTESIGKEVPEFPTPQPIMKFYLTILIVLAGLFPAANGAFALAYSYAQIQLEITLVDLSPDDELATTLNSESVSDFEASLESEADDFDIPSFRQRKKSPEPLASESAPAIEGSASSKSTITASANFYQTIKSEGRAEMNGFYTSIAYLKGVLNLPPNSSLTIGGTITGLANAGGHPDYSKADAYVLFTPLLLPPVESISFSLTNNDKASKPVKFGSFTSGSDPMEIGFLLLTSAEGFSVPDSIGRYATFYLFSLLILLHKCRKKVDQ